ncbi:MAG: 2-succinyl-5-enolpyruvyl-6-hydroxy-3-cyclohexene-1-carboxylic-acid synthase [Flavobacteriales bacterium]|jgi:2-succinyl-5-enolpyruvyl-6-hydroxy-3-cyclohexene-1-carboxylate synthase|nr:2-succinyl-5-enolpyruvyl-6-hydroxy-3-cyclohexene-1-carboxylic-acid synthase [Flavobacteriales bacterium]
MVSESKRVQAIVELFAAKGIKKIIFSPGSRNAPLVLSFTNDERFECISIVDERSASFFALGVAISTQRPVAICCTSGSAALNYSSALSEAFYQKIPLIAITTDRPPEWIHHGEGQAINQVNVFQNFVHSGYHLPIGESLEDLHYCQRQINEALIHCSKNKLPVHINIPFREPLYNTVEKSTVQVTNIENISVEQTLAEKTILALSSIYNEHKKVLILCGQLPKNGALNYILEEFALLSNTIVLTESTANLYSSNFIPCIDRVITTFESPEKYEPELLITIGNAIISKKIKQFLRNVKNLKHWRIADNTPIEDTYLHLTKHIPIDPTSFFRTIKPYLNDNLDSEYKNEWFTRHLITRTNHDNYMHKTKWSDLKAFNSIYNTLPENCNLHLGNSSPVRYMQLFSQIKGINYFSNRGVSGIDGSTSTAAGIAYDQPHQLNILISGDLSFVYDINALWNQHLSQNFRIIILNNGGGGIFRIIPGPNTTNSLEDFFEVGNSTSIKHLASAHHINYYHADDSSTLEEQLPLFFNPQENKRPAILEIFTPNEINASILKEYFKALKD